VTVDQDRHPDPLCEAIRASITEDEILQADRTRGVRRSAGNPVDLIIVGNLHVGVVDEIREWRKPGHDERLLAETGVYFDNAKDAASVAGIPHSTVRESRNKKCDGFPYNNFLYGNPSHFCAVRFQRKGQGNRQCTAYLDRRMVSDPEKWLSRLGDVEILKIENLADGVSELAAPDPACSIEAEAASIRSIAQALPLYTPAEAPACASPPPVRPAWLAALERMQRECGLTLDDIAARIGLSRPTLSNAKLGRYDLGSEAEARLRELLRAPPPRREPMLL